MIIFICRSLEVLLVLFEDVFAYTCTGQLSYHLSLSNRRYFGSAGTTRPNGIFYTLHGFEGVASRQGRSMKMEGKEEKKGVER